MKLTDYKVLSFDCYGTLIDWESGMYKAYQPLLAKLSQFFMRDEVLQTHARHEAQQEAETPSLLYSEILALVYARVAKEWGHKTTQYECEQFGHSIQNWPAFIDSASALQYLKKYYKLVILSNIDNESFKSSHARLQVEFDHIFTAEDIGTYKPNLNNFNYMLEELAKEGIQKSGILHTAESLFHDHLPANELGLASAWIHRRHAEQGFGATHAPATMPHYDFKFQSLADMAKTHQNALRNA